MVFGSTCYNLISKINEFIGKCSAVLYNLLESVRVGAILLKPYLPDTAEKILRSLNTEYTDRDSLDVFGYLESGIQVVEKPEILFQRLNEKEIMAQVEENEKRYAAIAKKISEKKEAITYDDFEKIELRVAKVLSCERHPRADKLFVLKIDLGGGEKRTIVSGLAQSYTPGQVIGKNIVVIANLEPAVIRGVESQGMLLAGKDGTQIAVVEVNGLEPGTRIQ